MHLEKLCFAADDDSEQTSTTFELMTARRFISHPHWPPTSGINTGFAEPGWTLPHCLSLERTTLRGCERADYSQQHGLRRHSVPCFWNSCRRKLQCAQFELCVCYSKTIRKLQNHIRFTSDNFENTLLIRSANRIAGHSIQYSKFFE